jgi:hypothetical protein
VKGSGWEGGGGLVTINKTLSGQDYYTRLVPKFQNELFLGLNFESNFTRSDITTIRFLNLLSKIELLEKNIVGCEM